MSAFSAHRRVLDRAHRAGSHRPGWLRDHLRPRPALGPFGQRLQPYLDFASTQFDKRMKVLERDRGKSIDDIVKAAVADLSEDEKSSSLVHANMP
jgi:hypothetical protein